MRRALTILVGVLCAAVVQLSAQPSAGMAGAGALSGNTGSSSWSLARVQASAGWDVPAGAPAPAIAVLDTGVDTAHRDFAGKIAGGYDFVNGDASPDDDNWHGTAVAGVAAGARPAGGTPFSYCVRCGVLAVKVLDAKEKGDDERIARGVSWAVAHGARVINLSFNGASESPSLRLAIQNAAKRGVVVVASAGNEGASAPSFPAADPNVIGVAATDKSDRLYSWSNRGTWVTVAAPGVSETSLRGADHVAFIGTSAAAPAVAGTAALCLSVAPKLSPAAVKRALVTGADPIRGSSFGRLNVARTLAACAAAAR